MLRIPEMCHFLTPAHFEAWKFYTQKCIKLRQNTVNLAQSSLFAFFLDFLHLLEIFYTCAAGGAGMMLWVDRYNSDSDKSTSSSPSSTGDQGYQFWRVNWSDLVWRTGQEAKLHPWCLGDDGEHLHPKSQYHDHHDQPIRKWNYCDVWNSDSQYSTVFDLL